MSEITQLGFEAETDISPSSAFPDACNALRTAASHPACEQKKRPRFREAVQHV